MKKLFGMIIILTALVLFSSCGKSEKQIRIEKYSAQEKKTEQLKVLNKKAIEILSEKYKSVIGWDTSDNFTYELQEMFIDEGKLISFEGELKDIIKSDSTYFLVVNSDSKNCIARISIKTEKFINLKKQLKSKDCSKTGCFVFKVSKIISASPEIKSDFESDGEYSYLDYDFDHPLLIINGDLIDFYLIKIVE